MSTVDGRLLRGERARTATLDAAVALATESGLDGLSFSQLAERAGVSKSGLFAHWSTKEELQLAAVAHAGHRFTQVVVRPALRAPRGIRRLWALQESRLADLAGGALPGGCFFANAQFEFTVRPGSVRDALSAALADWHALLERLITEAVELGELRHDVSPAQLAFELNALGTAAVYESRLLQADAIYTYARVAALQRLRGLTPAPDLLPEA
ncbi:TetR/AcrR family transcriptional regulator [Dactylosporangium aurantiacum]|uniref:TetR/AcrR family transcriptional regulator n=1 Tax=Dactylosporangium aurantiacum TaxID=35754 RepID=A0A9Q9IFA3_9ACTN|nr:TetR/AcrR family transcriptional regulator [Dactylosporangium aurantiacum]MDG6107583.1 TetR family transcriptional regulator [Dactylosporangium aurantiacum]UWZ54366.1 TetR/AcrR family transcriptional regulator [Dactylosporangium aurantiacum]